MSGLTTTLQQQTILATGVNWTQTLAFAQFDPALGTLVDARFTISGNLSAAVSVENLSPSSGFVQVVVPGSIFATVPGLTLAQVFATPATGAVLGAYDGTTDFGGTSGTVFPSIAVSNSASVVIGAASLGGLFTGTGTVDIAANSAATVSESSSGNLRSSVLTTAGAVLSLQYDYIAANGGSSGGGGTAGAGFGAILDSVFVVLPGFYSNSTTATAQTVTLPAQTTGWTGTATFNQFDPALGTLLEIDINTGNVLTGQLSAENLGAQTNNVSFQNLTKVTVATPGTTPTIVSSARASDFFTLGAVDFVTDFAGAAGVSHALAPTPVGGFQPLNDAAALAAFTGTGTIALPVSSSARSGIDGSTPNLLTELTQQTDATVTVTYVYRTPAQAAIACFAAGTRIATPDGEVAVEALAAGQRVSLADGGAARAIWIGRRRIDCQNHANPESVWPVRVRMGAFGDRRPAKDLWLSPDHAVFAGGVLIPVKHLIDGDAIAQIDVANITYFHIETEQHDIILAENLPVETYLDIGDRARFDGAEALAEPWPNFVATLREAAARAEIVVTGPRLAEVRARLGARARRWSWPDQPLQNPSVLVARISMR